MKGGVGEKYRWGDHAGIVFGIQAMNKQRENAGGWQGTMGGMRWTVRGNGEGMG
jgi:hypothetical protein